MHYLSVKYFLFGYCSILWHPPLMYILFGLLLLKKGLVSFRLLFLSTHCWSC